MYLPPPGQYVYDVEGFTETTGLTNSREPVAPTSTDQVNVTRGPATIRMTVITTDVGRDSSQEVVVAVTETEARLVRLSYRPGTAGIDYSISPDPPALLARFPYELDDTWEIAWNDPSSGISGTGTGTLTRTETVDASIGTFDTVVITVTQKLRGTISGTLTITWWIVPDTGVQVKQHTVTDLRDATGASWAESTRTLRQQP